MKKRTREERHLRRGAAEKGKALPATTRLPRRDRYGAMTAAIAARYVALIREGHPHVVQMLQAEFGLTNRVVVSILHRLEVEWRVRATVDYATERTRCLERLETIYREAATAWEVSKRDVEIEERLARENVPAPCRRCMQPSGRPRPGVDRATCNVCGGKGETYATVVTVKHIRRGQAGDPRFLMEMRGVVADVRRFHGLDAPVQAETQTFDLTKYDFDQAELDRLIAGEPPLAVIRTWEERKKGVVVTIQ